MFKGTVSLDFRALFSPSRPGSGSVNSNNRYKFGPFDFKTSLSGGKRCMYESKLARKSNPIVTYLYLDQPSPSSSTSSSASSSSPVMPPSPSSMSVFADWLPRVEVQVFHKKNVVYYKVWLTENYIIVQFEFFLVGGGGETFFTRKLSREPAHCYALYRPQVHKIIQPMGERNNEQMFSIFLKFKLVLHKNIKN